MLFDVVQMSTGESLGWFEGETAMEAVLEALADIGVTVDAHSVAQDLGLIARPIGKEEKDMQEPLDREYVAEGLQSLLFCSTALSLAQWEEAFRHFTVAVDHLYYWEAWAESLPQKERLDHAPELMKTHLVVHKLADCLAGVLGEAEKNRCGRIPPRDRAKLREAHEELGHITIP